MRVDEMVAEGDRVMAVCNACRYCEQYCPVFPAMERRVAFGSADLTYLANLCHNCGECLYACQYAPPHEFNINVPRMLAEFRVATYEDYCWPRAFGGAFRTHGVVTSLGLALAFAAVMAGAIVAVDPAALARPAGSANFFAVIPHELMVALFGGVGLFVLLSLGIGLRRFWHDIERNAVAKGTTRASGGVGRALADVLTLRHLHPEGVDCVSAEETRVPWRRWFHHATFYGFGLCFLSTTVAAIYHVAGWPAPYAYTSLPVVLGTVGGLGLLAGPIGLLSVRARRDPLLTDPAQGGLDHAFITLLLATSATGLALLVLRHQSFMAPLLVVHLGTVLALFVTMPYGKFVHGFYRTVALVLSARETAHDPH